MRRIIRLLVAVLSLVTVFPIGLSAQDASGNRLIERCGHAVKLLDGETDYDQLDAGYCLGMAHVARNLSEVLPTNLRSCIPRETEEEQLVRIIAGYLRDHPEELHRFDTLLVLDAVQTAFPCCADGPCSAYVPH